ncbi:MAG: hypothetical protein R3F39_00065 [Myxococcota bacterium]
MNARTRLKCPEHTVLASRDAIHVMALHMTRAHRGLLSKADVRAVADVATVEAAKCWDITRGVSFAVYARGWVRGALLKALRHERAQRRVSASAARAVVAEPESSVENQVAARHMLSLLIARDQRFLIAHHFDEVPLAKLAARCRHHPSWASRRLARLRNALVNGTRPARKQKRTSRVARTRHAS